MIVRYAFTKLTVGSQRVHGLAKAGPSAPQPACGAPLSGTPAAARRTHGEGAAGRRSGEGQPRLLEMVFSRVELSSSFSRAKANMPPRPLFFAYAARAWMAFGSSPVQKLVPS